MMKTRHSLIALAASAVAVLALTGCGAGGAPSDSGTLTLLVEGGGKSQLSDIADLYTQETGNKVEFVELPYTGLYDRINSDLASGTPSYDLAAVDAVWLKTFESGFEPLDDIFTDDVKSDLFPALVAEAKVGDHFIGMPAWTNAEVLMYRTDLFEDPANQAAFKAAYGYDLVPPADWQQYSDVAQFFTQDTDGDGAVDLYGTDVVAATDAEWLATVLQAGAESVVLDGDTPIINDADHKRALDFYVSLLPYSPAGAAQTGFGESFNLFDQGQIAMFRFWASAYSGFSDESVVSGNVGVAPMIAGPGGIAAIPGAWYLSIPKGSANEELAREFIQFVYDNNAIAVEKSAFGVGSRISAFEQFAGKPGYEVIQPLIDTLNSPATHPRPASVKWQQIVDSVIIPLLQAAVEPGADTQALLDAAQAKIEDILS